MKRLHAAYAATAVAAAALAAAVALGGSTDVETRTLRFDVLIGRRTAGTMRLEVMTVSDLTVIDEEFAIPYRSSGREKDAGYTSQIVYKGAEKPNPTRAEITTRIGEFKIMTGKATFTQSNGRWAADAKTTGFADTEGNPFETARTFTNTSDTAGDLLLTHAAFLHFAPRLLPKPGKIENVVHVKLPDNLGHEAMLNFEPGCILQRHPADADGQADITLHRVYAGGNIEPVLKMTVGPRGQMTEAKLVRLKGGGFRLTLRPAASALEQ